MRVGMSSSSKLPDSGPQPAFAALGNGGAYDPAYLQSAYNLAGASSTAGQGRTVAICGHLRRSQRRDRPETTTAAGSGCQHAPLPTAASARWKPTRAALATSESPSTPRRLWAQRRSAIATARASGTAKLVLSPVATTAAVVGCTCVRVHVASTVRRATAARTAIAPLPAARRRRPPIRPRARRHPRRRALLPPRPHRRRAARPTLGPRLGVPQRTRRRHRPRARPEPRRRHLRPRRRPTRRCRPKTPVPTNTPAPTNTPTPTRTSTPISRGSRARSTDLALHFTVPGTGRARGRRAATARPAWPGRRRCPRRPCCYWPRACRSATTAALRAAGVH